MLVKVCTHLHFHVLKLKHLDCPILLLLLKTHTRIVPSIYSLQALSDILLTLFGTIFIDSVLDELIMYHILSL